MTITENVDPIELKKFADVAAHWWDENGELKTLHQINPLRLGFITEKVDLSGKLVVDVGCGGGILSEAMSKAGAKITGIDLNKALIDVAKLHQLESKTTVEYLHRSVESLAKDRPHFYDVLTCLELLEHVPDPLSLIRSCVALVKPGGQLFFSTINRNPKAYLFAILGAEYLLKLLPKNTHDYAKFIKPSELCGWLKSCGIHPLQMKGMIYQPFTNSFKLSDNISVNYLLHARKT